MKLASVLNPDFIYLKVPGGDARSVYENILRRMLPDMQLHGDVPGMAGEMLAREKATGVAYAGIAYPHLRLTGYDDLGLAVAVLAEPVRLHPDDVDDTRIVFMSLVGEKSSDFYLKTLAAALRYLSKPAKLDEFVRAGSAEAMLGIVERDGVMIKKDLTAEDLMDRSFSTITPDKTLREAFDLFTRSNRSVLPVVDEKMHLQGVLDAVDIISKFIPEYVFMLPNTQFLDSFQPFEALNREEGTRTVAEFMRPAKLVIAPDTPLFRCTVEICRHTVYTIFVTEADSTLVGDLTVKNIIHRVLRG